MSSSPPQSSLTSTSSSSGPGHKWTSFEVRTLITLIIKGEHRVCEDPTYFTDRLNSIVNPARVSSTTGRSDGARTVVVHDHRRDIPHAEAQKMLDAVVAKKKHAVDMSERFPTNTLTREKMRAFSRRRLTFAAAAAEDDEMHKMTEREEKNHVEKIQRLLRRMQREMTGMKGVSPLLTRRERSLLLNWGIGPDFFHGEIYKGGLRFPLVFFDIDRSSFWLTWDFTDDQDMYTPKSSPERGLAGGATSSPVTTASASASSAGNTVCS